MSTEEQRQTAQNVVATIRAIYDMQIANDERIELSRKIEEFKRSGDVRSVFTVAQLIITSPENEETVNHAGWVFLEHLITFKWLALDEDLQNEIKGVCFDVMSGQPLRCNLALKTAVSRCFVGILQHGWPNNKKSDIFVGLRRIVLDAPDESFGQIEVVYLVVQRLIENVVSMVATSGPSVRRRELNSFFSLVMPEFVMDTLSRLKACMSSPNQQCATIIAKSALAALRNIVEHGKLKWFAVCLENMVDLLCVYLKHPAGNVMSLATRCLEALVSRKGGDDGEEIVKVVLRDSCMQAILENASLAIDSSKNNPDCYEYLKAIVDLLVGLGAKLSNVFEANKEPQNFVLYISAISVFFAHPSTYIRSEASRAFISILGNKVLRQRDDLLQMLQQRVLPEFKGAYRQSFNLGENCKDNPFDEYDYDDDSESQRARNALRTIVILFLRSLLQDKRLHQQINEIVRLWIEECRRCGEDTINDECDALTRVIRITVATPDEEMKAFYSSLFSHYLAELQTIPKETARINQLVMTSSFLSALIPTLRLSEVPVFISEIGQMLKMPYEKNDTSVIKRHAIALLLRMVKCMKKDDLLQIAEPVLNFAQESMASISPLQQGELLQVTACLSNLIPSIETRVKFLGEAAAPVTAFFLSEKMMKCVTSLHSFMEYSGFTSQGVMCDPSTSDNEFIQNRVQLRAYLVALEGLLQNVQKPEGQSNPLFIHIRPAIPVIFALARCVRNLDRPEALSYLHPSFERDIFAVSKAERDQALCSLLETMENYSNQQQQEEESQQQSQRADDNHWNVLAQLYCFLLNCHVQTLIGFFAEKLGDDFFAVENLKDMLDSTIEDLAGIPQIRLKSWLKKAWRSVYVFCPPQAIQAVGPSFAILQEYMRNLLDVRWKAVEEIEENYDAAHSDEETLAEHITCILQREFVAFLKDVLVKNDKLTFWLDDQAFCDSLMLTMLNLILHNDSLSCTRALSIIQKIIREKYNTGVFQCDEQSAVFIFRCALQAYHLYGKDELMETPLLALITDIYTTYIDRFQQIMNVIVEAVNESPEDVEKFHKKWSMAKNDKMKRNIFRELFHGLVKPPTAVLHKRQGPFRAEQPSMPSIPKIGVEQNLPAVADLFGSG